VVGLLAAIGILVGSARPWASATSRAAGLPTIQSSVSGTDLAPLAGALGVVVLAAFGAVIATRGWVRRGLGLLIVAASCVVLIAAVAPGGAHEALAAGLSAKGWSGGAYESSTVGWRWLVLICALLTVGTGAVTARYGGEWAVMGQRYDAPEPDGPVPAKPAADLTETEVWRSIDQGHDPTRGP